MSKATVDLNAYPRLFASANVPDQECHEVWLYLTYYGVNYNFPATELEEDEYSNDEYACSPKSKFAMITEPLEPSQNSQWSFESTTEQILTPKLQRELSNMMVVDEWATTPRLGLLSSTKSSPVKFGNLRSPSIIMEANDEGGDKMDEGNILKLQKGGNI
ncbi:hypothetical protein ABW21_db0209730 [Orbilia brochopaga]|nr:hypothetical protein ABW21_db0209730 [Drechslerella brochopaga]